MAHVMPTRLLGMGNPAAVAVEEPFYTGFSVSSNNCTLGQALDCPFFTTPLTGSGHPESTHCVNFVITHEYEGYS